MLHVCSFSAYIQLFHTVESTCDIHVSAYGIRVLCIFVVLVLHLKSKD